MPTQTKFLCPSGGVNVDFSGVFEELNGGTQYGIATNFKVGALDLTGYFHASTSVNDRPSFNTGYKIGENDLSTIFRRRGFVGISINTQPTNQVVVNNSTATFSIAATALGTPTYQWYKNTVLISGATSTTYTTAALTTANDTDAYFCRVSYSGSSVDSNSVNTRIKPYITAHPSSSALNEGNAASVTVSAAGSPTLSYQWYRLNGIISGANSTSYSFTLSQSNDDGYYCKVTSTHDATGVNSNTATISIIAPDVSIGITGFSSPYEFNEGQVITITAALTAGTNVTYQWHGPSGPIVNGANGYSIITSGTQLQFTLSASNDGNYYVVATNGGGSDTSTFINIVILAPIATISVDGNQTVYDKTDVAVFNSSITNGATNVSYQWKRNGTNIGTNSLIYSTPSIDIDNVGTYTLTVTNNGGSMTTTGITIYVNPYITVNPSNATVNEGSTATFTITAFGSPTLTYTWYRVGVGIVQTGPSNQYITPATSAEYNAAQYYCVVSTSISASTDTSSTATLTVNYIDINQQPSGGNVNASDVVELGVSVSANPSPPTYRWQYSSDNSNWQDTFDNEYVNGSGTDTNTMTFEATSSDTGYYRCSITNASGTVYSNSAYVFVN